MSQAQTNAFVSNLAELALFAPSARSFRCAFLELATRHVGAGHSSFFSSEFDDAMRPAQLTATSIDPTENAYLEAHFPRYMGELTPLEQASCFTGRTIHADEVITARRREQLAMFNEFLRPHHYDDHVLRMWKRGPTVQWFAFARPPTAARSRFVSRSLPALDQAFPVVALAEKLFASRDTATEHGDLVRDAARTHRLTRAEHRTMDLVLRGLTNPEIASVLGISLNTVRNRLVAAFAKLGVTRRAEAAYVLLGSTQRETASHPSRPA